MLYLKLLLKHSLHYGITTGSANQRPNTPCIILRTDVIFQGVKDSNCFYPCQLVKLFLYSSFRHWPLILKIPNVHPLINQNKCRCWMRSNICSQQFGVFGVQKVRLFPCKSIVTLTSNLENLKGSGNISLSLIKIYFFVNFPYIFNKHGINDVQALHHTSRVVAITCKAFHQNCIKLMYDKNNEWQIYNI